MLSDPGDGCKSFLTGSGSFCPDAEFLDRIRIFLTRSGFCSTFVLKFGALTAVQRLGELRQLKRAPISLLPSPQQHGRTGRTGSAAARSMEYTLYTKTESDSGANNDDVTVQQNGGQEVSINY